jgi:hypothetical protein
MEGNEMKKAKKVVWGIGDTENTVEWSLMAWSTMKVGATKDGWTRQRDRLNGKVQVFWHDEGWTLVKVDTSSREDAERMYQEAQEEDMYNG